VGLYSAMAAAGAIERGIVRIMEDVALGNVQKAGCVERMGKALARIEWRISRMRRELKQQADGGMDDGGR